MAKVVLSLSYFDKFSWEKMMLLRQIIEATMEIWKKPVQV